MKQGDALSPMLLSFAVEDILLRRHKNVEMWEGLQLNGAHELLLCYADINLLGENIRTVQTTQTLD
jgi:hypothetical protein